MDASIYLNSSNFPYLESWRSAIFPYIIFLKDLATFSMFLKGFAPFLFLFLKLYLYLIFLLKVFYWLLKNVYISSILKGNNTQLTQNFPHLYISHSGLCHSYGLSCEL